MSSTSQSVSRTIQIFKIFAQERRALNATEVGQALSAPRSSCAALLKTLVELAVLSIDRRTSTYFPTARFAELGRWLIDGSLYPEKLITLMRSLQIVTGETITLAAVEDLTIEMLRVEKSRQAISFTAETGQTFSIWGSGLGMAYLATRDNQQIRALYRRAEDRRLVDTRKYPLDRILEQVEATREQKFAELQGAVFADATAVAVAAGISVAQRPLIIAIAGPTVRLSGKIDTFGRLLAHEVEKLHNGETEFG